VSADDIQIYYGQTYNPIVAVTKDTAIDTDTASPTYNPCGFIDITGRRFRSTIKQLPDRDYPALLALDSDNAGEFTILAQTPLPWSEDSTLGQVQANYTSANTATLTYGRYYVDFWMLEGSIWVAVQPPFSFFLRDGATDVTV
jgi:hypothetical protein